MQRAGFDFVSQSWSQSSEQVVEDFKVALGGGLGVDESGVWGSFFELFDSSGGRAVEKVSERLS